MPPDILDLDLCSASLIGHSEWELRPSVIRSEFFRDYTMQRILIAPERAWVDMCHTPAIGVKSASRIATVVGCAFAQRWPDEWRQAVMEPKSPASPSHGLPVWPVTALRAFIEIWGPDISQIERSMDQSFAGLGLVAPLKR